MELIDLHCHILPYVDDGAADMEEALELLSMEAEQGVTEVCLTPHLRRGMFNSTDEKIRLSFQRLCGEVQEAGIPIRLHLSREYYYDSEFIKHLSEGSVIPMGSNKVLLVEFSYSSSEEVLLKASREVQKAGYLPLFAHVERYHAVQNRVELVKELAEMGTLIQMNASSFLNQEGWKVKRTAMAVLKTKKVHVIASDSHDCEQRKPNLGRCAEYLEKKIGRDDTQLLMSINPLAILK